MDVKTLLIISFVLSVCVSIIPKIGIYFRVLNTLIHEVGHAFFSLILDGRVKSISLFSDASGLATTGLRNWFSSVIVSYAGYTFSSLFAFLSFYLISIDKLNILYFSYMGIVLISLIFWVRNMFGLFWCISFLGLNYLLLKYANIDLKIFSTLFFASIILNQSVYTSFVILKRSWKQPSDAGDATSLRNKTFIPSFIWGLVFFGQSLFAFYYTVKEFIF